MAATQGTSGFGTLLRVGDAGDNATLTHGAGDAQLVFTADDPGAAGNNITITLQLNGIQASTTVQVTGLNIVVTLESSDGIAIDATAGEVATVLEGDAQASALIDTVAGGTGLGNPSVLTQTNLAGGGANEAFSTIAEVTNISGPSLSLETIDATHMESPDSFRELIPSLKSPGEVSFDLNFLPANASQVGVLADFSSRYLRNFQLHWTDVAVTKWQFAAYVTGFEPSAAIDDKLSASVTLTLSGAPNFSA